MPLISNPQFELARSVGQRLLAAGASDCLLVGGFVRDSLLDIPSKDVDLEVYGLNYDQIVAALSVDHASVNLVGRSFGVVKVGQMLDVSMPRRESKSGMGHKGFAIDADPTMTPHEACARRDFTINAIGMRLDGSIFDPFDGRRDLQLGVLRATSRAFQDDPLRVLRGMQFAARFGLDMEAQTAAMCREMVGEYPTLSPERIWEEWRKWAAQGRYPGKGLETCRLPDQPGGESHQDVERRPHRSKHAGGRIPGGFDECAVPTIDLRCGGDGPETARAEADSDEDDQADPAFRCIHVVSFFVRHVSPASMFRQFSADSLGLATDTMSQVWPLLHGSQANEEHVHSLGAKQPGGLLQEADHRREKSSQDGRCGRRRHDGGSLDIQ